MRPLLKAMGVFVVCAGVSFSLARGRQTPKTSAFNPVVTDTVQLVMIVIGKKACAWSNRKELVPLVSGAKAALKKSAQSRGMAFMTIGVGLDWSATESQEYLSRFEQFDEISAGFSWSNAFSLRYMQDTHPGPTSTPQIIVLQRRFRVPVAGHPYYSIENETIVTRKVGLPEIDSWVRIGSPLPDLSSNQSVVMGS